MPQAFEINAFIKIWKKSPQMLNVAVQNRKKICVVGKSEGALRLCASGFVVSHTDLHFLCSQLIKSTFTPNKTLYASATVLTDYLPLVFGRNTFTVTLQFLEWIINYLRR